MKQYNLFGEPITNEESKYNQKIKAPIYEPKNIKPHVLSLIDETKTNRLIREIKLSNVSEQEKTFLIEAAKRHTIFNYSRIADYYAHSSMEMQKLMEQSGLVIIDYEKAIQFGFVKLSDRFNQQFLNEQ